LRPNSRQTRLKRKGAIAPAKVSVPVEASIDPPGKKYIIVNFRKYEPSFIVPGKN
jgi:hypothetical protein